MKNDLIEKLYYIENSYSVEDIEYFGIKMWPFLRAEIIYSYYYSDVERQPMTVKKQSKLVLLLQILKTTSFGLFFKKYASLILTDDVGMKYYNGRCIDRIMEGVFEYELNNIPFIIKMSTASVVSVSRYINASLITIISRCLIFVRPYTKQNFKGEHILIDVLNYLQLEYNYMQRIRLIESACCFYRWYFDKIQPKNIYVNCYYDLMRMPAFFIAKQMGIPIIEIQHGIIYSHHFAYIGLKKIEPNPYPNYILVCGSKFKSFISPAIYEQRNILITGSFYIHLMQQSVKKNAVLFKNKYNSMQDKIIITIASQSDLDMQILQFIEKITLLEEQFFFIFVPRFFNDYHKLYKHKQITIESELDVYQCMQNSHITSAVVSTCALESLVFGTPAVLINIDDLAKTIYAPSLRDINSVFYADTPAEYVELVKQAIQLDRNVVQEEGNLFFADNYEERLQAAFSEIEKSYTYK